MYFIEEKNVVYSEEKELSFCIQEHVQKKGDVERDKV